MTQPGFEQFAVDALAVQGETARRGA